ncbi:MAG: aminopeptidase P family protein [Candidatus Velthaea sp.]
MADIAESAAHVAAPDVPTTNTYDDGPPPALLAFMVTQWAAPSAPPEVLAGAERFAGRRAALSARFPGEALIVATGHEKVRANDTTYRFRPGTDFYYLTGNQEADCVLVMLPNAGGGHDAVLYVEPNPGKTDATFFTDRAKGELWVGPRLGVAESAQRFGIAARGLPALLDDVRVLNREDAPRRFRLLRGMDAPLDAVLPAHGTRDAEFAEALAEMRLIKDDFEIGELEKAVAATAQAFTDVVRALPNAASERHVEGIFHLRARIAGNDTGYNTIAAAGRHACILHWTANNGELRAGDLLLLDAGVEAHTLYTADVTRTLPVGGRFSDEQRAIYSLVFEAQNAGFAACAPGNDFMAPNAAAMRVLAYGLERLGILPMRAEDALREQNQFYKRYSLHNVSHMLGLDVHDCAAARRETYKYGKLQPGMVLTVEPGLYLQPDDLTVPERFRGIGVRIEDDVVITPDGYRNLSAALPRDPHAIEAWMRDVWAGA